MSSALRLACARTAATALRLQSRPYSFTAGATVLIAPDAFDAALGCGGLVAAKARRGDPLRVLLVAAGGPADPPLESRRTVATSALGVLGVPAEAVHCHPAPAGRLGQLDGTGGLQLRQDLRSVLRTLRPGEVFVPFPGHGEDGDATYWILRDALAVEGQRPAIRGYAAGIWRNFLDLGRQLGRLRENLRFELGQLRPLKRMALERVRAEVIPAPSAWLTEAGCGPEEFFFQLPP